MHHSTWISCYQYLKLLSKQERFALRNVTCWDQVACSSYVVVFNHNNLQVWSYCWIVCNHFRQAKDQWMISCAIVGRSCFTTKENSDWASRIFPALMSKYLWITYKAFICWRLYSWRRLIWVSKIEFGLISTPWWSFKKRANLRLLWDLMLSIFLWLHLYLHKKEGLPI